MEEKAEISLERYDKLKQKEATYDNLVSETEALKISTKEEIKLVISHILNYTLALHQKARLSEETFNDCARQAGFTAIYKSPSGSETKVGDGSGKLYIIENK